MIEVTPKGLYCAAGDFYIDPWRPVERAVITHGHGDHARGGSSAYWCATSSVPILRKRLGANTVLHPLPYGAVQQLGEVSVSLHPAGHILGSAQVRLEHDGQVWVVSGDYKRAADPTTPPFEVVPCDVFITEATFGLPIYRWQPAAQIAEEIAQWWRTNRDAGRCSLLLCYALGKAQRLLAELAPHVEAIGQGEPVLLHGAMAPLVELYRVAGAASTAEVPFALPPTQLLALDTGRGKASSNVTRGALVLAPPSAFGTPWCKRLGDYESGFVSGWMQLRGMRRRRGYDRGFALSDHADWPALLQTIAETGAQRVLATHGHTEPIVRYLQERGIDAAPLQTEYEGEHGDARDESPRAPDGGGEVRDDGNRAAPPPDAEAH